MAWFSLYKWYRSWSKRTNYNWLYWYNEYIEKTEEQRLAEARERERAVAKAKLLFSLCDTIIGGSKWVE